MPDAILTLNAGSSSLKLAVFEIGASGALTPAQHGAVTGIGEHPQITMQDAHGTTLLDRASSGGATAAHEVFLAELLEFVDANLGADVLVGAGHRVVHGGTAHTGPALVTPALLTELDALTPLAPLHQPHNLAPIRALAKLRPNLPQVACFDTAFHHTMPAVATRFALPATYTESGVRRYGFHGLSYAYIGSCLPELAPALATGRVIAAHLGAGASLCAMRAGASIDTTMGFTALDGLMMATRCGTIDPGVVLYLQQQRGLTAHAVEDLLYHDSGLLGVSGISGDMRHLHESADPRARAAIELFVYRIVRECGALVSVLGGIDGLIFTAGIGEHDAAVRSLVCAGLHWLGVALDPVANEAGRGLVSAPASRVAVWVVPTDEERMIARETVRILNK